MSVLAITGGTGFVGRRLIDLALAGGHAVRALTRRTQPPRDGLTWVEGALDQPDALATLVADADAVIHVAGVVNAADRAGFATGNIDGTRAMIAAAAGKRFVHVSSLSAREPQLSSYGWSKAEAEHLVEASGLDWTIVRPTAVYGPGDTEMRDLFRMAARGVALLPPRGRASLIAVDDLAALLLILAARQGPRAILEVDDGVDLSHADLARAIGVAVGRRVRRDPHAARAPGTGGTVRRAGARHRCEADSRPRRLSLPSGLDDKPCASTGARSVASCDFRGGGSRRHRQVVSRA